MRARRTAEPLADPEWMARFVDSLHRADLAAATVRGYRYDLRHFLRCRLGTGRALATLAELGEHDLIAYRQHMVAAGHRPASVNRRLDALRRLCRWAMLDGSLSTDVARGVRPVRTVRNRQPTGLSDSEVHGLLRAAGASTHGLAARNYALVQLMLQAGLRVGEVSALTIGDVVLHERSGLVRVRHGKGLKHREVPLNATARRALRAYLKDRPRIVPSEPLFLSGRHAALPIRSTQAVVAGLARRARIERLVVSAHTLRHTFALNYLRDNPGKLVELAGLLGHESLDTTAIYTRPSAADLAADLERSHLNTDG